MDGPCGFFYNYKKNLLLFKLDFLSFPACFSIPIISSNFDFNCSNLSSLRNLQEQVKKAFCYQELFWPFTVWINCSSDLKIFENSRPSASNFKSFSRSLEQFFLTIGKNNFENKIPIPTVPSGSTTPAQWLSNDHLSKTAFLFDV